MKCQAVHSVLLGSERPNRLPAEVIAHLKGCALCRVWQRRMVRLEHNVGLLAVPPAPNGKEAFVRQFLTAPAQAASACDEAQAEAPLSVDSSTMLQVRKFDKLAAALRSTLYSPRNTLRAFPAPARRRFAAVLAAAMFFLAFGLWSTGPTGPFHKQAPDRLLAQVMQHDIKLASAQSPRERIETLADLADVLQNVTRELFDDAGGEELNKLAGCYEKVVHGIVKQARALPPEEQAEVVKGISQRLHDAGEEAERLARVRPEASAGPLFAIRNAARKGEQDLPHHGAGDKAIRNQLRSPPVLFASLVFADVSGMPSNATRAKQLQRNVGLIENAVVNSLRLAGEQDPLQRAGACAEMAERLADAIRQANADNDTERALELAQHLHVLLKQGVAANLAAARNSIPNGSADEQKLLDLQDRTARQMGELLEELPVGADAQDDRTETRLAVDQGRAAVEKVKRVKAGS